MRAVTQLVVSWAFLSWAVAEQTPQQILVQAATAGDTKLIEKALTEVDPNTTDALGRPVLHLAAASGSFEAVRALLWAGANPTAKDQTGNRAIDQFAPDPYNAIQLLLRCYAFVRENGVQNRKLQRKNLVLVSDNYVDFTHPGLSKNYWRNPAELNGRPGIDDDGNGFIDDVNGWNVMANRPPRSPNFNVNTPQEEAYVTYLLAEKSKLALGNQPPAVQSSVRNKLAASYTNPLVTSMGYHTLKSVGVDMSDLAYANMLTEASHGTHVAGLVVEGSDGKALVHTSDWGGFEPFNYQYSMLDYVKIFETSKTFNDFAVKHIDLYRDACLARGKRGSAYLKSTGAGVVNMSWSMAPTGRDAVTTAYNHYRERMNFPADLPAIDKMSEQQYNSVFSKPFQEARIAQAAAYALLFYENPDVLFVIAAGNSKENNDFMAPLPAYLSKFFPNVISVASHRPDKTISEFSSYGKHAVQIAALGENLRSTAIRGNYCVMQGTSMAAPLVAGVCAAMRLDYPSLSATDIRAIIMESAEVIPSMKDLVESGGVLNKAAAKALAVKRSAATFINLADVFKTLPNPRSNVTEFKPTRHSTVAVAGGVTDSLIVMTNADVRAKEMIIKSPRNFPNKEIDEAFRRNFRITAMGQSSHGHTIVMKTGTHSQKLLPFDQSTIASFQAQGFHIKALSGYAGKFSVMMEQDPTIISQRFSMPTPFTASRQQWILDRWNEGYTLTAVGGDDDPKNPENGFIFVMSKTTTPRVAQIFNHPAPWPAEWIQGRVKEGYGISSVAGIQGRYLVVMTKGLAGDIKVSKPGEVLQSWLTNPK